MAPRKHLSCHCWILGMSTAAGGGEGLVDSGSGRQAGAENSREPKRARNWRTQAAEKESGNCWPRGARWRRALVGRRCRSVRACGRGSKQAPKPAGAAAATGCTPMRRSAVEGRSRPLTAAADTHTPLGAARCGRREGKCSLIAHAARERGLAQNDKVSRGSEPRSPNSGSRVLTVTP